MLHVKKIAILALKNMDKDIRIISASNRCLDLTDIPISEVQWGPHMILVRFYVSKHYSFLQDHFPTSLIPT